MTFEKAVEYCENKNMKLATIRSPKENTEIAAEIERYQKSKKDQKGKRIKIIRYGIDILDWSSIIFNCSNTHDYPPKETYWTSGNDLVTEGQYKWQGTGADVSFTNWHQDPRNPAANEPNDEDGTNDCVLIYGDENYKWFDHKCEEENFFVCEYFKKC